jgi:hypothetical protein
MEVTNSSYDFLRIYAVTVEVNGVKLKVVHQEQTARVNIKTNRTIIACCHERLQPVKAMWT